MSAYLPTFISEFPDHPVTDCVPSSGLMLVNKITHNRYPGSILEREALQNAMGTQDQGATFEQLRDGIAKRYGLQLPVEAGWSTLGAILASGSRRGVAIIGQYQKLSLAIRQRSLQPSFDGLHCIYAQPDGTGTVTFGDPLATQWTYGLQVADLRAYADSYGDRYLAGTEQPSLIGYRLNISGLTILYRVMRFTHVLYGGERHTFVNSHAPVAHGSPGFWMITAGPLTGRYAVYGKTAGFSVTALYSDGGQKAVSAAS